MIIQTWHHIPKEARGAAIALGNLDGVHLGHRAVLHAAHAARPDLPLAALTFEPHPREHFRPDDPPFRLTLLPAKAAALKDAGATFVFALPFDDAFAAMTAEDFVEHVLHRGLGARHLACGPDFAFGHRRGGDVAFLQREAERRGMGLTVVPPLLDGSEPISSTRIRRLLQDGYPDRAAEKLGRPWEIRGTVVHGDKLGRVLGWPTANIWLGRHLEPARGVYAVTVGLPGGREAKGVANVGRRPTLGGDPETRLETHIFDFEGDLYGQEIGVRLIRFLRPDAKFAGLDELKEAIARDVEDARAALG
ncbi:bifunctional riboflavin kinase/FAD synthetase [Roseomonas alkaliterrae]|uniref:Riboflavin biosynthesis protein n=1 Tax=Neoroseomonas alkaliterrae TaxID=1452450 RepID=A0A840XML9_9PROT|nr:bifunctional riboflavin kinase/FAD synthetase [Neoroseomonas alkaliterrae]MBB5687980.1 riboflavin kinase/FMN adenylyltransferase [Neoroseomonas alkaliterrae]MBR0678141.1 bifunctional riboflavin kinase/FAD synthetase [Neoroseomonas alkaliterrae]